MSDFKSSPFANRVARRELNRRDFLRLASTSTVGIAAATTLQSCAIDPVTGERTLVGMSVAQEKQVDKQHAPHQFSNDYGAVQDEDLNRYIAEVGENMALKTHRPDMPYNYKALNATYVNAYTFPAGSMGITRGILLEMDNEDELAALLGHELGHVNARHSAERAGRGMIAQLAVMGATIAAAGSEDYRDYTRYIQLGSTLGASALLSKYSRDNEREADALGMHYMVEGGHSPEGMVGLMEMLQTQSKHKPDLIETMFSSHPMSDERYATAVQRASDNYVLQAKRGVKKERYMDTTASLRRIKPAIEKMQEGSTLMAKKKYAEADPAYSSALKKAPEDYAGLVMMAKCQMAQKNHDDAQRYLERAKKAYPEEAQAIQTSGVNKMALNQFDSAYEEFSSFQQKLPGNPDITFLKGMSLESMGQSRQAANEYMRYLRQVRSGGSAQHAHSRLTDWGYIKPRRAAN